MRAFRRTNRSKRILRANGRNHGFTLLEMLVTASLSAVLMVGLWNLFGTYLRLFSTGQAKAEHSQLVRALTQQFSDDLSSVLPSKPSGRRVNSIHATQNAIPFGGLNGTDETRLSSTSPASSPANNMDANFANISPEAPGSGPGFGLIGTQQSLRLDILRTVPSSSESLIAESSGDAATADPNRPHRPKAPQLRSILYTFEEPREVGPADRDAPPGLIRRESDWETVSAETNASQYEQSPLEGAPDRRASAFSSNSSTDSSEHFGFADLSVSDLTDEHRDDESMIWVREMIGLRFRYFDGREWYTHWDSYQRQALPVAVEIVMQIVVDRNDVVEESHQPNAGDTGDSPSDESPSRLDSSLNADQTTDGLEPDSFEADDQARPIYRQVVYLPAAGSQRGVNDGGAVSPIGSTFNSRAER